MPDVMIEKYNLVCSHDSYDEFKYDFTCVEYENRLNHLQNRYDRLANNYSDLKSFNDKLKKDYADLEKSNQNLKKSNKNLENQLDEILNSKSWKVTEPLRKIMNIKMFYTVINSFFNNLFTITFSSNTTIYYNKA